MKTKFLIPLIAGLGLLCACKGKGGAGADSSSTADYYNKNTKSAVIQTDEKLVKTADMHFKVKNVQQTSEHIATLTTELGGTIIHHKMSSKAEKGQDTQISSDSVMRITIINSMAEMTVKIPPGKMETFVTAVSDMGIYVDSLRLNIDDKSLQYLSADLKNRNKEEVITGEKHQKNPDELLALKNQIVDQKIANRAIDDSVKNSTITLHFYESNIISKEIVANDDLSTYGPSFSKRFVFAIQNGWEVLENLIVGIAYGWFLLPIIWGGWLIYKNNKSKKSTVLVKAN